MGRQKNKDQIKINIEEKRKKKIEYLHDLPLFLYLFSNVHHLDVKYYIVKMGEPR